MTREEKRRHQRFKANATFFLFVALLLLVGFALGRMTAAAKEPGYPVRVVGVHMPDKQWEKAAALSRLESLGMFTITHYCCEIRPHICGTGTGITASGIPVRPGLVAVDPDVIPLGTTVYIDGQAYLAADTGGAILGNRIDIAVETHAEALELGVREAEVFVLA